MKQFNKLATFLAAATLVTVAGAQEVNNWRNASGEVWKNAAGECWRNASWTPATAAPGCDGALAPKAAPAPAPGSRRCSARTRSGTQARCSGPAARSRLQGDLRR